MRLYCGMGAIECPVHTKLHFQWSIDKTTGIPYIMDDANKFEWDNDKAITNWQKHGVSFSQAIKAFNDPFGIERFDERENYGEERINLIGMCDGVLLHITYTERGERIRLISARKAEKYERNDYYRENAQGWDGG
jgi:uncharacterized protein